MNLYFARHAQSMGNIAADNGCDPPLTELGRTQASLLGERLSVLHFDAIIASPLIRAVETANAVAKRQPGGAAPVELLPDLMECGTPPSFVPQPLEALRRICPTACAYTIPTPAGGGESLPEEYGDAANTLARAYRVIGYLRRRFSGSESILIVTHGTFLTSLISAALRFSLPEHFNYSHDNTGLSLVRYLIDNGSPHTKLGFLNDVAHLYRAGLTEGVPLEHAL